MFCEILRSGRRIYEKSNHIHRSDSGAVGCFGLSRRQRGPVRIRQQPDDPNEVDEAEPIDTSVDTFEYDQSLAGTTITLLNSKAEIQNALVEMGEEFEKKSGVHVEVMPVTDRRLALHQGGQPVQLGQSAHHVHPGHHRRHRPGRGQGGRPVRRALAGRGRGLPDRGQRQGVQLPPVHRGPRHHLQPEGH